MPDATLAIRARGAGVRTRLVLLLIGAVLGTERDVSADGWKVQLTGVKALGVGYAGRATAEDATIVWFNAAGMTALESKWTVTFGGALIPFALDYTDLGSRSVLGQPLTGPTTSDGGRGAFVPHMFVVRRLGDRWRLGAGFNAPYGLSDDYGTAWVGRYHATESTLRVVNLSSAVAVALTDRLSLGFGLDVQSASTTLANRIDFGSLGAILGFPVTPQGADGGIEFEATSWGVGFDASVAWQLTAKARLAATYREQVEHTLDGDATFDLPAAAAPLAALGGFRATPASAVLPMPRELSLATAIELGSAGKWTLVADVTWTDWSRFEALTLDFENPAQEPIRQDASFEDSARVGGGVIYAASPRWTLRAGALYEKTPVPDATRTPRLPEENNFGMTAGGTWRLGDKWELDFAWSHLVPHDASILRADPLTGTLNGTVRWRTDSIAVGTSIRF
jgi:long-chain fatty acid transport protein